MGPGITISSTSVCPAGCRHPGFALGPRTRRTTTPKRVRYPAGCSFASGCSPPRIAATQLPSATCGVTSHGLDFHLLTKQHHRRTVLGNKPAGSRPSACPRMTPGFWFGVAAIFEHSPKRRVQGSALVGECERRTASHWPSGQVNAAHRTEARRRVAERLHIGAQASVQNACRQRLQIAPSSPA